MDFANFKDGVVDWKNLGAAVIFGEVVDGIMILLKIVLFDSGMVSLVRIVSFGSIFGDMEGLIVVDVFFSGI